MKPEIKQAWIEALRSGNYQQTTKVLRDDTGFCCLGVLCELHNQALVSLEHSWEGDKDNNYYFYHGSCGTLSSSVIDWSDIGGCNPKVDVFHYGGVLPACIESNRDLKWSLAELNDNGLTFSQVADIIQEQL